MSHHTGGSPCGPAASSTFPSPEWNNQAQPEQEMRTTLSSEQRGLVSGSSSVLMGSGYKGIREGRIPQYHFHRMAMAIPFFPSHKTGFLPPTLHETSGLGKGRNPEEPGYTPSPALNQAVGKDLTAVTSISADKDNKNV